MNPQSVARTDEPFERRGVGSPLGPRVALRLRVKDVGFWIPVLVVALLLGWILGAVAGQVTKRMLALPFLLLLGMIAAIVWRERGRRGIEFLSPLVVVLVLFGVLFALVPLADVLHHHTLTTHPAWWKASWLAVASLALLYVGYALTFWLVGDQPREVSVRWSVKTASLLSWAVVALSIAALVNLVGTAGGIGAYIALFRQRTLFLSHHVYLVLVIGLAPVAFLLQVANWVARPSFGRAMRLLLLWLPGAILATSLLGARFRIAGIFITLAAAYHYGRRRIPRSALVGIGLAIAIFFVIVGVTRNYVGAQRSAPALSASTFYSRYLATHDLGEFREFVITVEGVPSAVPFQHGRTFLSIIPGNSFPTGGALYSSTFFPQAYATGTSLSPSLPGELYMNFGTYGIAAGMLVFGVLLAMLEWYRRRNVGSVGALVIYSFSVLPMALIVRGDFTSMAGYFLAALVPLWVATKLSERHVIVSNAMSPPKRELRFEAAR
jgi:oligosaccharide repeat unit polymerase